MVLVQIMLDLLQIVPATVYEKISCGAGRVGLGAGAKAAASIQNHRPFFTHFVGLKIFKSQTFEIRQI